MKEDLIAVYSINADGTKTLLESTTLKTKVWLIGNPK